MGNTADAINVAPPSQSPATGYSATTTTTTNNNNSYSYGAQQPQQPMPQKPAYNNLPSSTSVSSSKQSGSGSGSGINDMIDFGDKVVISYNFWKDNVDMLERSKQQQLGVLLFANLFKKQPLCRNLFADSDITKQSLRLLDMFGWLLRSLIKEKNHMRVRTLKSLGDRHVKYGIKTEFFRPMLDSLSDALQEWFGPSYNAQVRIALTTLFQSACNEMMKQAGQRAPFGRLDAQASSNGGNMQQYGDMHSNQDSYGMKSYRWLRSIDHCLADPMGLSALEEFLSKTYQTQLVEFHKAYRIYRCCLVPQVRQEIAHEICKLFLTAKSQFELNDSGDSRKKIFGIMQKCDELQLDYPIDLFDETHTW
eukprot:CAMPEP_0202708164 /NCGR_PEP_ID=MMETSP1385-20130828/20424_1 /ASSEMBLY_ACC=CAM_ASM_000861 /TAXON_ID=933848 /ORGANISM="Elphidium margaritaceum" /LENGTH=363 /DNA_ID=CAMNT_0049367075 /DNA_START=84 /DNA_END=1172 /DNA_ORIENTATION=-